VPSHLGFHVDHARRDAVVLIGPLGLLRAGVDERHADADAIALASDGALDKRRHAHARRILGIVAEIPDGRRTKDPQARDPGQVAPHFVGQPGRKVCVRAIGR
jgi:hypothetical protein